MDILASAFEGKNMILCGIGSGQGTATAKLLLNLGANVFGISRSGRKVEHHSNGVYREFKCDLQNLDEIRSLMNGSELKDIEFSGLINNTGTWAMPEAKLESPKAVEGFLRLNLMTQYNMIYEMAERMIPGSGIVNIGASHSLFSGNGSGYTISKYALEEVTRIAASALKPKHIRVNCVQPGSVSKDDRFQSTFPFNYSTDSAMDPLKIGYVSTFLLSPMAAGITGVSIPVDDGMAL